MDNVGNNSAQELKRYIERLERLAEERQGINDDMKDVRAEAKSNGFDVRTINKMIAERRMEKAARDERLALEETYRAALGL
jgi:uncharacterized protein (UPF0335 family)